MAGPFDVMSGAPQRVLRAGFMAAEGVFNRAFGDKLNPLYHLGALTFYLFWLVVGSGLYLYAFFDTSVEGAYRSVEALTHGQWFAGGILRSVHCYASDAMVVCMLLHLARYWAFDRLRGFRWFSWVTGVVLIWLVFAAGVNGYMLPWDRLAQFVTQASFEWIDWLPGFGGTLIRNFIYDYSVSNRLFSLLVFIHIGVPLLILLLLWVHVQRVPKASTLPPRPIIVSVAVMLLILALVQPVVSQGGAARLAEVPAVLSVDWFLLALYPLVYLWPIGAVWGLVLGVTALLALAPWLPPRRRGAAGVHRVTLHPGAVTVEARSGETLLEAGLRNGLSLPYECRAGGCGLCVATVLNGRIEQGNFQPAALTAAMRARGQTLLCCATALEDVEIDVPVDTLGVTGTVTPTHRYRGVVEAMEPLGPDVLRLWVRPDEGQRVEFVAGQYINIVLHDGARRAYSFANAPHANDRIELHVRRVPGGRFTTYAFEHLRPGDTLEFEGPFGQFTLHEDTRPILFIAGATGFAPVKSILEDAFHRDLQRPMWLYWGVRTHADLYMADLAEQWQREHPNFHFVPVLSELAADDPWPGRRGFVHEAMLADFPDMREYSLYACGSVGMVEAAVPAFIEHGLDESYCYSDGFVPAQSTPPDPV